MLTDEQIEALAALYSLPYSTHSFSRAIEAEVTAPLLAQIAALTAQLAEARKDSGRYQWLRSQHWEENRIGVVLRPKDSTRLGSFLPSDTLLDDHIDHMRAIDAAIAAQEQT